MHLNSMNMSILPHVGGEEIGKSEEEPRPLKDLMNKTVSGAGDGDDEEWLKATSLDLGFVGFQKGWEGRGAGHWWLCK